MLLPFEGPLHAAVHGLVEAQISDETLREAVHEALEEKLEEMDDLVAAALDPITNQLMEQLPGKNHGCGRRVGRGANFTSHENANPIEWEMTPSP